MPFLQAGFNFRNRSTGIMGWTRHVRGERFAPSRLIVFTASNDYAWYGDRHLAWGECVVLGSHYGFDLPHECTYEPGLPHCDLDTREEHEGIDWARDR